MIQKHSPKIQFNKERASILDHIELVDYIILLNRDEIDEAVKTISQKS